MKRLTLTFDNGPHEAGTPQVLDVLARRGLKATFFAVGERLLQPSLRSLAERIRGEGHRIGNHSLTHSMALGRTSGMEVARLEIGSAEEITSSFGSAKLFRPNGEKGKLGAHLLSEDAVDYLEANRFTVVAWNCVPQDWVGPDGAWVDRAWGTMRTQDWTVLVLHDHCQADAIPHLERFLDDVSAQGYEFSFDFPADVLLMDAGRRLPALARNFTPRPVSA